MSMSCHWFGVGGPNCTADCPEDCFGDFTKPLEKLLARMKDFQQAFLGTCDLHGTPIMVHTTDEYGIVSHMVPWEPAAEATMSFSDWKRWTMGTLPGGLGLVYGECHCSHPSGSHCPSSGACPPDCLGHFTEPARLFASRLRLELPFVEQIPRAPTGPISPFWVSGRKGNVVNWHGRRVLLGTCDLHGDVNLVGLFGGRLYVEQTVTWPPDTWGFD